MVDWSRFRPEDFEYDFDRDKLTEHGVAFEEAVECGPYEQGIYSN